MQLSNFFHSPQIYGKEKASGKSGKSGKMKRDKNKTQINQYVIN